MTRPEFESVVFEQKSQWETGLRVGLLGFEGTSGLRLHPRPMLESWVFRKEWDADVKGVDADEAGQVYWLDQAEGVILRRVPLDGRIHPVATLPCDSAPEGLAVETWRIWTFDRERGLLYGFDLETGKLVYEIGGFGPEPAWCFDGRDRHYVADADGLRCIGTDGAERWRVPGRVRNEQGALEPAHPHPVSVAAHHAEGLVMVLDRRQKGFFRYRVPDCGSPPSEQTRVPRKQAGGMEPTLPAVGRKAGDGAVLELRRGGTLLFAAVGAREGTAYDVHGFKLGTYGFVQPGIEIHALGSEPCGVLHVATNQGLARFVDAASFGENGGVYVTQSLDNGPDPRELWHRVGLSGPLPEGTGVQATYAYAFSGEQALRARVDAAVRGDPDAPASPAERLKEVDDLLAGRWREPDELIAGSQETQGDHRRVLGFPLRPPPSERDRQFPQYVWVRLSLRTYESAVSPRVKCMTVVRPRKTYLRYLPAMFRTPESSADLLGRFLTMFEVVNLGIEDEIERIFENFDPDTAPAGFLPWLARWLDVSLQGSWPLEKRRRLISSAYRLYQDRGTARGLANMLRLATGEVVQVVDLAQHAEPPVVGETALGRGVLQDRSQWAVIITGAKPLGIPLLGATPRPVTTESIAGHVFVEFGLSSHELEALRDALRPILREFVPAHVTAHVRSVRGDRIGFGRLDKTLRTVLPRPIRVGGDAVLGEAIFVTGDRDVSEIGTSSIVGSAELT